MSLRLKVVEYGECESRGLACACLRLADHIRAGEHERDHACLDGCGLGVAKFSDGLQHFCAQVEGSKIGCHLFLFMSLQATVRSEAISHLVGDCFVATLWLLAMTCIRDVSMTLFNFLLANQSFSLQISSPNKKARRMIQRAFRVIKTIPRNITPRGVERVYHGLKRFQVCVSQISGRCSEQ